MNLPIKNLGTADRIARGIVAVALISYSIFGLEHIGDVVLQAIILFFVVLNLSSFIFAWCPVYKLANISTRKSG